MSESLEKITKINRSELSEIEYFETLIKTAYSKGIIDEEFVSNLQVQLLELLKIKSEKYNLLLSSSIEIDMAKRIMESNVYTISLYLKGFSPDEAINVLKNDTILNIYDYGRKAINRKTSVSKILYKRVLNNTLKTSNEVYNSTVLYGIKGFFKVYNPDYEAEDMKITADYPLYNSLVGKLCGIEFIEKYLESLYIENEFCSLFKAEAIENLLAKYTPSHEEAVINIFKIVLIQSIGCVLAEETVSLLTISSDGMKNRLSKFNGKTKEEIYEIIYNAYMKIKSADAMVNSYILKGFKDVQFEIYNGYAQGNLDITFV